MAERKVLEYNGSVFENTIARNLARRYPNAIIIQNRTLYSDFLKNDTQIDLILIQRKGIFIIEAKNWKRWVKGDYNAGHWKGQAASMNILDVFSPINQNIIHVRALRNAIRSKFGIDVVHFHNVVCFPDTTSLMTSCTEVVNLSALGLYLDKLLIAEAGTPLDTKFYYNCIMEVTSSGK